MKHLQVSKHCPTCNIKVHETQPLLNLRADRTLQDIVYKLVPGLFESKLHDLSYYTLRLGTRFASAKLLFVKSLGCKAV